MRRLKLATLFFSLVLLFAALNVFTLGPTAGDGSLDFSGWPYECLGYYSHEDATKLRKVDWTNLKFNCVICIIFAFVITNAVGYCFPRRNFFDRLDAQNQRRHWLQ